MKTILLMRRRNVDVRGLQTTLQQSNEQARLAMEEAKEVSKKRCEDMNRIVKPRRYAQFPELDPDNPEYIYIMFYILRVRNHIEK